MDGYYLISYYGIYI